MRAAYLRALDLEKTYFSYQCNDCKVGFLPQDGKILYLRTSLKNESDNKTYKLWYCSRCSSKFDHENFPQED